jgi:ankyrin repeat protein
MPNNSSNARRSLPDKADLRHLKDQARDLLSNGQAVSITNAQFQIAQLYGFASWPKLKAHVESLRDVGRLKQAIDKGDFALAKELMRNHPELHRAPMGYANNGPLTWVAECRVPFEPPNSARLALAEWMIENGSDVHQGGDGPLMRAALRTDRIPMMEVLVRHGADVNAEWNGDFPILFAPCESIAPGSIRWLLEHGADPNCERLGRSTTALDYLLGTYARSPRLGECVDLLRKAGGTSRYDLAGVFDTVVDDADSLAQVLEEHPSIRNQQFPELDFGSTGARRLLLNGATLLHVAAEFASMASARLLLERGALVNSPAMITPNGLGGQTPIFHSVSQFGDFGLEMTRLLMDREADLAIRAKLPGYYENPDEVVECTPLGYALRFPGIEAAGSNQETIRLLREKGAPEYCDVR